MAETITLISPLSACPGEVVIPGRFTGADEDGHYQAGFGRYLGDEPLKGDERLNRLQARWKWARDLVIEWRLDGVPTNLPQIRKKEEAIPFALISWLPKAIRAEMDHYVQAHMPAVMEKLVVPDAETMTAGEFFAWDEAWRAVDKEDDPRPYAIVYWPSSCLLVRDWGGALADEKPPADGRDADLALLLAVYEKVIPAALGALNLGNSPLPPGAPSTPKEG